MKNMHLTAAGGGCFNVGGGGAAAFVVTVNNQRNAAGSGEQRTRSIRSTREGTGPFIDDSFIIAAGGCIRHFHAC